jgi:SWI/SNF-related matrix-associated actin-dependent regulator of chromatin subfamily A3
MGLGKTVQAIALLLANPPAGRDYTKPLVTTAVPPAAAESAKEGTPKKEELKKPTKTALNKIKIIPLQNVLREAGVAVPLSGKKSDVVAAVRQGLEAGTISLPVYYDTIAQAATLAPDMTTSPTTLIVCPVSVMSNWQSQIDTHVAPHTLRVALYHGTDRREVLAHLDQVDVLICSYNTLQTDYSADLCQTANESEPAPKRFKARSLFQTTFHRVVLDEAHIVRNPKSRTFQAVASIQATRRWCLTGTPLQNKPQDIQSLLAFLGVSPLGDPDVFRRAVSQPIKEGSDEGLARLRLVMAHVALRRNKSMAALNMVDKQVRIVQVTMPDANKHKEIYDTLFRSAKACFQATLQGGDESALKKTASVFEVLTRLRQACCSGALVPVERLGRAEQVLALIDSKKESLPVEEGLKLLEKLKGALEDEEDGPLDCAVCLEPLVESEAVALRGCGHVFCQACIGKVAEVAPNCPYCRKAFVKDDMIAWSVASQAASQKDEVKSAPLSEQMHELGPSPKMEAMMAALKELKSDEKAVCFSQFTKFLDQIERFLKEHGFSFTRIDGKKSATQRMEALSTFSKDDGPTIMLCSLHAAGTGINLTRANHVMMMDTWWNAAVEQQAMDRVHRIGQTRPVQILRFVTAGSVESRMLSLQEAKAAIGKGAFENLSPEEKKKARLGDVKKLLDLQD